MTDRIVMFYTTGRRGRFSLYGVFLLVGFFYVALNIVLLSRSEREVSYEVATLLALMVVLAPVASSVILRVVENRVQKIGHGLHRSPEIDVISDREFLAAYAAMIGSSMDIMAFAHNMTVEQLRHAERSVLRGIALIVYHFYGGTDSSEIRTSYMRVHAASALPPEVWAEARFVAHGRPLDSYEYVLELVLWVDTQVDIPKGLLAVPVERILDPRARHRLLPGAAAAFALGMVSVIEDTRNLSTYFQDEGRYVDQSVVREQLKFFESHRIRSFAAVPLNYQGKRLGVLNVEANEPGLFGPDNEYQEVIID